MEFCSMQNFVYILPRLVDRLRFDYSLHLKLLYHKRSIEYRMCVCPLVEQSHHHIHIHTIQQCCYIRIRSLL